MADTQKPTISSINESLSSHLVSGGRDSITAPPVKLPTTEPITLEYDQKPTGIFIEDIIGREQVNTTISPQTVGKDEDLIYAEHNAPLQNKLYDSETAFLASLAPQESKLLTDKAKKMELIKLFTGSFTRVVEPVMDNLLDKIPKFVDNLSNLKVDLAKLLEEAGHLEEISFVTFEENKSGQTKMVISFANGVYTSVSLINQYSGNTGEVESRKLVYVLSSDAQTLSITQELSTETDEELDYVDVSYRGSTSETTLTYNCTVYLNPLEGKKKQDVDDPGI